ncbi:MAG: hypothetical protein JXR94_01995 [Candidatus Hydrogenedentes bacterium]|nr:hypothetical protein [Candidatus Hydrogenedentota bacterium]
MLKVGTAIADITPPLGVELSGFGYYLHRASSAVLDRLMARAVYIESGAGKALLIGNDLIGVDVELTARTRALCAERLGLPPESVMLAGTHTHSGPVTATLYGAGERDMLYWDHLPYAWADLAARAVDAAKPAAMYTARGTIEPVGRDRYAPEGPADTELRLIRFDVDGRMAALLINHSAHAVMLGGANTQTSADWPGWLERTVEAEVPGVVAPFLQGSCGTINPIPACLDTEQGAPEIERVGRRVAADALALAREATPAPGDVCVEAVLETVPLPAEAPARAELIALRDEWAGKRDNADVDPAVRRMARMRAGVCQHLLDTYGDARHAAYPAEVQTFRIGPARIVGIPGEMFMALGQRILDAGNGGIVLLAGYANDWMGYFPTREAFGDPRFEYPTQHTGFIRGWFPFAPGAGERLVDVAIGQCQQTVDIFPRP